MKEFWTMRIINFHKIFQVLFYCWVNTLTISSLSFFFEVKIEFWFLWMKRNGFSNFMLNSWKICFFYVILTVSSTIELSDNIFFYCLLYKLKKGRKTNKINLKNSDLGFNLWYIAEYEHFKIRKVSYMKIFYFMMIYCKI